ncbi:MAG: beta-lactamase family protein [Chloroflexi bacterium]|nr:beta-lactamase family protein [Chloroflexota bacterium]
MHPPINGTADPGYTRVADAFAENFALRHDLGAAVAVYVGGEKVVDLWGGVADSRTGRAWEKGTEAVIFSCSKGVLAICVYLLVQEGQLDLDRPVAHYWPEFAQMGKHAVTVRSTMTHRAGLACLDSDLTLDEVIAWTPVIEAIERQRPASASSSGHFYHAMTSGWLIGEVIRRVTGVTPGIYFRRAIGVPLSLDTWLGLYPSERSAVAWMEPPLADEDSRAARDAARASQRNPDIERSLTVGGAFAFPALDGVVTFNDPAIQAGEIPAANGISTARSLARLYAGCVSEIGGPPLLSPASIADATTERSAGPQLSGMPDDGARWGTGFQLASPPSQPMLGNRCFGHAGAGGQLAFADAEHQVGFAYLSNQMGGYGDARARVLTQALGSSLDI